MEPCYAGEDVEDEMSTTAKIYFKTSEAPRVQNQQFASLSTRGAPPPKISVNAKLSTIKLGTEKSSTSSFSGNTITTTHTKFRHYRAKIVGLEVQVSDGEDVLFGGKWAER